MSALKRHQKQQHSSSQKQFTCHLCPLTSNRKDIFKKHLKNHEKSDTKKAEKAATLANNVNNKQINKTNEKQAKINDGTSTSSSTIRRQECQADVNRKNMSAHLKTLFHKKKLLHQHCFKC